MRMENLDINSPYKDVNAAISLYLKRLKRRTCRSSLFNADIIMETLPSTGHKGQP